MNYKAFTSLVLILILFFNMNLISLAKEKKEKPKKNQKKTELLLEKELSSLSISKSDQICGYVQHDIVRKYKVVLPANTYVCGEVSKVKKAGRFSKNAVVVVNLKKAILADNKELSIEGVDFKISIPKMKSEATRDVPGFVAYCGTYFPLQFATSLCAVAADAIGMGAGAVVGAAYGAIFPAEGKSRARSSLDCAINATPLFIVVYMVKKGKNFEYSQGETAHIKFSKKEVKYLEKISQPCDL